MQGWFTIVILAAAQLAAAVQLIRRGARRWWDYVIVAILWLLLLKSVLEIFTGDVSKLLPPFAFPDTPQGKDQIILASVASTLLLPLVFAAAIMWAANRVWRGKKPR